MSQQPLASGTPSRCLLVVDDQPMNIQALYRVFSADHQVLMATSGEKALAICHETPPDLILLDVTMPGMDGYEVLRRLQSHRATADIPVIFVTALDGVEDEAQGLALGAVDFIVKPIKPAIVRARVHTHLELASARALLSATLEATADGIAVIDLNGDLVTCNQRFTRMWNAPQSLLDADDKRQELRFIQARIDDPDSEMGMLLDAAGNSDRDGEAASTLELRDGRILQRHQTALLTHDRITGHVLSFRDVTRRVRAEREMAEVSAHLDELNIGLEAKVQERTEALAESERTATAANEAKGKFLSNMSHEMRTPMNSILGLSYLALRADPNPKLRDYLDRIRGSGQHLLSLISNTLDFSKIEAGKIDLEEISFSASSVIDDVLKQLSDRAEEKGLVLTSEVDPALGRLLSGDPLRIRQILLNFASNAIKFSDHGEVALRIRLLTQDDDRVEFWFEVQDQGIGLSEAQARQLFQPFHQADASITREYGGTGLGLAICRQLAELMGGEVGVRSQLGVGSTFWLRLPLRWGEAASIPLDTERADSRWERVLRGSTILVVDDNELNQRVAFELLQAVGAQVLLAGNGLTALKLLAEHKIDCVLMDVQMPGMDGLETTRRIRKEPSLAGLHVIAMTANARGEDEAACRAVSMDDFISKPVVPEHLYATLAKWLGPRPAVGLPSRGGAVAPSPLGARDGASTDAEIIDLSVLSKLTGGDTKTMRKIATVFINSMETTVTELEAALAAGDRAALAALGHKVKSSAGAMGAMGLSRHCQQLETAMSDVTANPEDARPLVARIRALKDPIAERLTSGL